MNLSYIWDKLDNADRVTIVLVLNWEYQGYTRIKIKDDTHYVKFGEEQGMFDNAKQMVRDFVNTKRYERLVFFDIDLVLGCLELYHRRHIDNPCSKLYRPDAYTPLSSLYIRIERLIQLIKSVK